MMFERKVYQQLKHWKEELAPRYACLLEGARRVGKTTIAEEFAKNEIRSLKMYVTKEYNGNYEEWEEKWKERF